MLDRFRVDYVNAVKENELRKVEEEKKTKRDMAKKAAEEAKAKKGMKRAPASTTHLLNDESEDVIETMLETLQSGGGNQVTKRLVYARLLSSLIKFAFYWSHPTSNWPHLTLNQPHLIRNQYH